MGELQGLGSGRTSDLIEESICRGLSAYRRGDFGAAAQALGELLPRLENETPELWERLGSAYFETRDFERAIEVLERVVSAGRATVRIFSLLAASAMELGRFGEELRYREAALDQAPGDPALWRSLGIARRRSGAVREAVAGFREALRLDPEDAAGAGLELGRALRELGERDGAVAAYREASRWHPVRSDLWSELASLYSEMGLFAESDQAVREAIRLRPANAAAWRTIATNTLKQGKRDTAQRAYRRMKELNPDFADEILSWVSNTAGLPADAFAEPVGASDPVKSRGRLLSFRAHPRT
ncbi:MAG: tetratricopeptide repeat protein [Thermoanaerobaculia bacterium]